MEKVNVKDEIRKRTKRKKIECDCVEWKNFIQQIQGAQMLAHTHGYEYTGDIFKYCPWCGKLLK